MKLTIALASAPRDTEEGHSACPPFGGHRALKLIRGVRQTPRHRARARVLSPRSAVFGLVLATGLLGAPACAHRIRYHDYIFGAEGVVTDSSGTALEGVRVTMIVLGPHVYSVIDPVRERAVVTDPTGRFQFMFISHELDTPYELRFEKEGFAAQTVRAVSPPYQKHSIQLLPASGTTLETVLSNKRMKLSIALA